ncbi:MAG TPA: hypothetical protein VK427_09165, partial [Kofleriaceae bacterium]|nr:hypothetical protein [Kofleriaceae bacterium]
MTAREDEWMWGWDQTAGIVSVWAEGDGFVHVWRRVDGTLVHEQARFRPWVLASSLAGFERVTSRELAGIGELRFVVRGDDMRALGAARGRGAEEALVLPPEEQYLVASG